MIGFDAVVVAWQRWRINGRYAMPRALSSLMFPVLYWLFCTGSFSLAFNFGIGDEISFKQLLYPRLRIKPIAPLSLPTG